MPTQTKPTHTPTPWKVVDDSNYSNAHGQLYIQGIGNHGFKSVLAVMNDDGTIDGKVTPEGVDHDQKANAAFIVRAVNSHEELMRVLNSLAKANEDGKLPLPSWAIADIYEALAKAEGKE